MVTRYFGGTLLGTGGPVLRLHTFCQGRPGRGRHHEKSHLRAIHTGYELSASGKIQYGLTEAGYEIEAIEYEDSVSMQVLVREPDTQHFQHLVSELSDGKIQPAGVGTRAGCQGRLPVGIFPISKGLKKGAVETVSLQTASIEPFPHLSHCGVQDITGNRPLCQIIHNILKADGCNFSADEQIQKGYGLVHAGVLQENLIAFF